MAGFQVGCQKALQQRGAILFGDPVEVVLDSRRFPRIPGCLELIADPVDPVERSSGSWAWSDLGFALMIPSPSRRARYP